MKRKLFIATVLILSGLLVVANKSYAWGPPSCYAPGTPALYSPDNGATSQSTSDVLLSWSSVTYGDVYYIYMDTFNPPTPQRGSTVAGITSWHTSSWSPLQSNTTYYWRIGAQHVCSGGSSGWSFSEVWHFTTVCVAPGKATNPSPAHQATDVSLTPTLSWAAGSGATLHLVYFGTNPTPGAGEYKGEQAGTTYEPDTMSNDATYYWRIDEKNACDTTTTGIVWSFTTVCTTSPGQATSPNPANGGATNVNINAVLSWTAGAGATSRDVYFGTNPSPGSGEFKGNRSGTTFSPGTLSYSTTYYWRIDEKNACDTTTGGVWSFTTVQGEIIEINSDITTNQLWTANNIYYVTNWVNVQALLVIEPGTMVIFGYGCRLFVNNGGTLISKGAPDKPIIYTCDSIYFEHPEDIGWYWWLIYNYHYQSHYFCPIYIKETASPATTVTYSFIEGAVVGIATENITLDHPIENNYLCGNIYGISEYGTKHTDIKNNLCFFNCISGIEVDLPSVNGVADANSHILIQNNTCDWQQYGITVHGVADGNDAGLVMLINNIVSESWWGYGLNLVDDGYMYARVLNTGYYGNYMNKNREFEEINPVEADEMPYVDGPVYFDTCYLNQSCPFINAGVGYIEETKLIGRTTNFEGTPDSNITDIGFHHINWSYANAGDGSALSGDLNQDPNLVSDVLEVTLAGTSDDITYYLLMDGQYFGRFSGGDIAIPTYEYRNGQHEIKVAGVNLDSEVFVGPAINITVNNRLSCLTGSETYEYNQAYRFAGFYEPNNGSTINFTIKDLEENVIWTNSSSGNFNFVVPAGVLQSPYNELTIQEAGGGGSGGEDWIKDITKRFDITNDPNAANARSLLVSPEKDLTEKRKEVWKEYLNACKKRRGGPTICLFGSQATRRNIKTALSQPGVTLVLIIAHGNREVGIWPFNKHRTFFKASDGPYFSCLSRNSDSPGAYEPLKEKYENGYSVWDLKSSFHQRNRMYVFIDACKNGTSVMDPLAYSSCTTRPQNNDYSVEEYERTADMAKAFDISDPLENKIYMGWRLTVFGKDILWYHYNDFLKQLWYWAGRGESFGEAISTAAHYSGNTCPVYVEFSWVGNTDTVIY